MCFIGGMGSSGNPLLGSLLQLDQVEPSFTKALETYKNVAHGREFFHPFPMDLFRFPEKTTGLLNVRNVDGKYANTSEIN